MTSELTPLIGDQAWFYHWINEREKARFGRENNQPKPWSSDTIIQNYRFCNVRREDDKVTKWIKNNWRDPNDGHQNMVFAMCVARLFNRVETLELIGFPYVRPDDFSNWLQRVRESLKQKRDVEKGTIWTGAYLVSTNGVKMDKVDYILDHVLTPIYRSLRQPFDGESLEDYHAELTKFDGLGSFMAGQVIADLKYTSVLGNAPDWNTWAPIGPGSRRGLNRYFGRELEASIKTKQVLSELAVLQFAVQQRCGLSLPVHDIQNCCCEYDKYMRVKLDEGRPRSRYNGA